MVTLKRSSYRQRVYQSADDQSITLVYGGDPAPLNADGSEQKKLADHDVVDSVMISDHVEPVPVPIPPVP